MTIYEYLAEQNPIGAKTVLNSFGEKAVRRPDILARQLADLVNNYGKDALFRIASVHPDLELVNQYNKVANPPSKEDCGCSKEKEKESVFSSADGEQLIKAVEDINKRQDTPKHTVAIIALALITKK